ncbi:MAG: SemiSWEET transporter [Cytophagaceae bacterium]
MSDEQLIEILGMMAAVLTTAAFIPQAFKVYRTGNTGSISLTMFIVLNLGLLCWLGYGLILQKFPIIFANGFTMIFALYILVKKIKSIES